jgi:hypothetical protein
MLHEDVEEICGKQNKVKRKHARRVCNTRNIKVLHKIFARENDGCGIKKKTQICLIKCLKETCMHKI